MKKLLTVMTIAILIVTPLFVSCGEDRATERDADKLDNSSYTHEEPEKKANNETPTIESMTSSKMLKDGKGKPSADRRYIPGQGLVGVSGFQVHIIPRPGNPVLIESEGEFAILYGAGDVDSGEIVRRYLKEQNVNGLNYLMIPSDIERTYAGATAILQDIPVRFLGLAGYQHTMGAMEDVVRTAKENGVMIEQQKAGAMWIQNGVTFEVLYPLNPGDDEDAPMVLRFSKDDVSFLLTGQIDTLDEKKMLERGKIQQTDVVIATNGAPVGSMSEAFIDALDPQEIIICGLPGDAGREALAGNIREIDDTVATIIQTDGEKYSITTSELD